METQPIALVLGFSIHGLAVARALHGCGIEVHAISESRELATCRTRVATVHVDERINSANAIGCLRDIRKRISSDRQIVLFPTNDKIVGLLADRWEELDDGFLLSWSESRSAVQELILKDGFAAFVDKHELRAPRSRVLHDTSNVRVELEGFTGHLIVKPVVPLGSFKALKYDTIDRAIEDSARWMSDCPVIIQEWIHGGDKNLVFGSYFLAKGNIVAEFSGRKLLSTPRTLGQGVIVEHYHDENLLEEGRAVAQALAVSGPVAVEFKQDESGRLWLIEANVGRTEYSVDLLIGAGLNLPKIEFDYVCGVTPKNCAKANRVDVTWLDTEKEPLALMKHIVYLLRRKQPVGKLIFPYFGHGDFAPLLAATVVYIRRVFVAVLRRIANLLTMLKPRLRRA